MAGADSKRLIRMVVLPALAAVLLLAALVGAVLHLSTRQTDQLALARQTDRVAVALAHELRHVAIDQEASTYWDDAVRRTRERPLDLNWIDNNLGVWFHTYYQIDETYLLDPDNAPIYAMRDGRRVDPGHFATIARQTEALTVALRKILPTQAFSEPGAAEKTAGAARIAMVRGRPALISVKPILPESGDGLRTEGQEVVHVAIRYLDGNFLEQLGRLFGIEEPRFVRSSNGAASIPLQSPGSDIVGYLIWEPFTPGEIVEARTVPALLLALGFVGLVIGFLLWRIQRSRRELEQSRAEAQHLAFHDSLTGLPNRALFENRLQLALSKRESRVAVLLLDLDRFKDVNDTLGHQAGDALIRQFGSRLVGLTRDGDTISRLGGDEFAVLVEDAQGADVHRLAKRILDDIRHPFDLDGAQVYVGVSIGIATSKRDGALDGAELVRRADIALYRAKDAGRNDYRLFSRRMDDVVKLRGTTEEDLREALKTGCGLSVHYQPLVKSDGTIVGIEALLRWRHPTRGLVGPEEFVPIAEESGLIVRLGQWVLDKACQTSRLFPDIFVAVNLSPIQFRSTGFFEDLMRRVRANGADPRAIQLEVTERVLLEDDDTIRDVLEQLQVAGFRIVLDDFGTGYSSLSYLHKFKVDKIKIDRGFVQALGEQSDSGPIVMAVAAMGRAMGLDVAAEGVETADQKLFLDIAGCGEMQGHYFSAAVPEDQLEDLLSEGRLAAAA